MADRSKQLARVSGPDAVRSEIEQTRARMSETIDEIEVVLLQKKADLREKLDIFRKVRERPLAAVGGALAAGLVLGLLTGGGKKKAPTQVVIAAAPPRGPDVWESRARRLLAVARQQQEEIELLRALQDEAEEAEYYEVDEDDEDYYLIAR